MSNFKKGSRIEIAIKREAAMKKEEALYKECPQCHGEGVVEKTIYKGDEGMKIEMDVPVKCDACEGLGKVLREFEI